MTFSWVDYLIVARHLTEEPLVKRLQEEAVLADEATLKALEAWLERQEIVFG